MKEFKRVVIAGDGDLSIGMGVEKNTDLPYISIRQLLEPVEVGSDTLSKESIELLTILFKNLESLAVVEEACRLVRERLETPPTKDLEYWRKNAEEDYMKVPISVLRYISELENEVNK